MRENLDDHRNLNGDSVFLAQRFLRASEECEHSRAVEIGLTGVHANNQPVFFEAGKAGHTITKGNQIVGDHVIAILAEDFGSELPAFGFLSEPKKIQAEL